MDSEGIIFRRIKKEDAVTLSEIERGVFGKNAWTVNDFIETVAIEYAYYLVAEERDTGRIVGICGYRDMCGEADITNVCIIPEMRKHGIAYEMLKCLMEYGLDHGVKDFTLEVRAKNEAAIGLYEKLGFISEGVRPGFYEDPKDDALIMWKRGNSSSQV